MRPVCVIVRDGWGHNESPKGNAVHAAHTPNVDSYLSQYPWGLLDAAGEPVGLPAGYQGSSEVGHLNMGAGRIVIQEVKRIDDSLADGSLFERPQWQTLMQNWQSRNSQLHLFGLLQDEGVHAHQEQLFKIVRQARSENSGGRIVVHPFLDGRDTPPRSCLEYLLKLDNVLAQIGGCTIGTFMGRYYAMDRSQNWQLTDIAYNCIVHGEGRNASRPADAVRESYDRDKTPDDVDMFDEYILPYVVDGYSGVSDGDCIIHTNYRQDRAIQLSRAFIDPAYPGSLREKRDVDYVGLTRYYDEFPHYLIEPIQSSGNMNGLLGEVLAASGLRQLRIAETQKYRHVTSFFNGKSTTPYDGEDDVEVTSELDPATFASHPEMEAYKVTEALLAKLDNNPYSFILVNFANGDMVGHTGDFDAAKRAVEVVDECVGRVVERLLQLDAHILITADHGNAELMVDPETGEAKTAHTLFPVDCIYVASDAVGKQIRGRGKLSDIAPTALKLLGLDIPQDMTAQVLLEE